MLFRSVALAEGSVLIENTDGVILTALSPAKEFVKDNITGEFVLNAIDFNTVTALKNGLFIFNEESLGDIVERLQRWYNVEIEIDSSLKNNYYSGVLNKHKTIQDIITILDKTKELQFVIDDKGNIKIIPMNYK